jgi:hypothetical protein
MSTYDDVLATISHCNPALVYVAIGPSQAFSEPETRTPQQYPPAIAAWPGHKVIILIDPLLETPVHAHELIAAAGHTETTTVFEFRSSFCWKNQADATFLFSLCEAALDDHGPHVIVQAYTGRDIRDAVPIDFFGEQLLTKVLYDMTYSDEGCRPDLSRVNILRDANGHFIQPFFEPLWALRARGTPSALLKAEADARLYILTNYVHRLYRIKAGREEFRDWCTDEVVAQKADRLRYAYGIPAPVTAIDALTKLIAEALFDFCSINRNYFTPAEITAAIAGDYCDIMKSLRITLDATLAGCP